MILFSWISNISIILELVLKKFIKQLSQIVVVLQSFLCWVPCSPVLTQLVSVFHHCVLHIELSVITATLLLHHTLSAVLLSVTEISLLALFYVIYSFSIRKLIFFNVQHRGYYPTQVILGCLWMDFIKVCESLKIA